MTTKAQKLAHYARFELKRFFRIDASIDDDGVETSHAHELMYTGDVALFIPDDASMTDVVVLLKKITSWIERNYVPGGLPIPTTYVNETASLREAMRIIEREDIDSGRIPF